MVLAAQIWTGFVVWLNVYCGIMLLNMSETGELVYALAALNFCVAMVCHHSLLPKQVVNDYEVELLKIKVSVLREERDSCVRQLNTINVNSTK